MISFIEATIQGGSHSEGGEWLSHELCGSRLLQAPDGFEGSAVAVLAAFSMKSAPDNPSYSNPCE
jgi:hypothetical protein